MDKKVGIRGGSFYITPSDLNPMKEHVEKTIKVIAITVNTVLATFPLSFLLQCLEILAQMISYQF